MQVEVFVHGRKDRVFAALLERCGRTTRHRLAEAGSAADTLPGILATARFSPGLELRLSGISLSGNKTDDLVIAHDVPFAARTRALAAERIGVAPDDPSLTLALHLSSVPYFLARYRHARGDTIAQSDASSPLPSPAGQTPGVIIRWLDASLGRAVPQRDGSLETARDSASAYALQLVVLRRERLSPCGVCQGLLLIVSAQKRNGSYRPKNSSGACIAHVRCEGEFCLPDTHEQ